MSEFEPDPNFIESYLSSAAAMSVVESVGEAAKVEAQAIAPVGSGSRYDYPLRAGGKPRSPGAYRRSIKTKSGVANGSAYCRLYSNDFTAAWIEYGNSKTGPRRILHQAVASVLTGATQIG